MNNTEIINGLSSVAVAGNAYYALIKDVKDPVAFEQASCSFIEKLCRENSFLKSASCLSNTDNSVGNHFGSVQIPLILSDSLWKMLNAEIPAFVQEKRLVADVKIDYSASFSMVFDIDSNAATAAYMSQKILVDMLKEDKELYFRCADFVMGGNGFSAVHKIVSMFPAKTGGKVYTKQSDFSELIKELDAAAADTMTKLGGAYSSVEEYNKSNDVKINRFLSVIYLSTSIYQKEELDRLRILIQNGKKNGMSFIIIGSADAVKSFYNCVDFYITCRGRSVYFGNVAKVPFGFADTRQISENDIEELINSFRTSAKVDTLYENHPALHSEYFSMDSASAVRIPFAIDKNCKPVYFEIGGNAPTHALIAGSTGSGKSVALHTLIMQIVHNYHPDDVELWAIDYKAVEFASYIDHCSPHFRVIAHDTSSEFSLSLIDLLYEEYEKRQQAFLDTKVKNINEYRQVHGKHSMPRIIAVIDEFQLMTQAVQEYSGNVDYRTRLENLLRLTRAMGISFVLCSQTIASGLSGLSEAARDQIGCRLCLKHDDDNEIRETLVLSGADAGAIVSRAKELRRGQGIYKRARWANEYAPDGKAYEYLQAYILYINDSIKKEMIDTANALLQNNYTPKEEIFVRGGGRIQVVEKTRHPFNGFINNNYEPEADCVEWYPAAPVTLADSFCLQLENAAAANIMLVGEDDALRESVVVHSVCGFLMNPVNRVVVSFTDENNPDRARMINQLRNIASDRMTLNIGTKAMLNEISRLKKIQPTPGTNTVYVWYGLDKLKNELFLMTQTEETIPEEKPADAAMDISDMINDIMSYLQEIKTDTSSDIIENLSVDELTIDDCVKILRRAFETGPENNKFNMVIFNNRKSMKKSGFIDSENFENRIGTRMSTDDSYELFGSSSAINKTNENTVIYYAGSGNAVPLRPYLMPDEQWFRQFNEALKNI